MPASRIVLAAVYEGGAQPISIGTAASHLIEQGFQPTCVDTFLDGLPDEEAIANTDLLAISLPLFQSIAPGVELAKRARSINPNVKVVMFGQHANIHAERLLASYCDYVIRGDSEPGLVALACNPTYEDAAGAPLGVCRRDRLVQPYIHRGALLPPARHLLPDLSRYRYSELELVRQGDGPLPTVGNIETARGCHHGCTYCSVFAATGRKVSLIPASVVMADIRQVVGLGATHIWFTDAEFLNSKHHGLGIIRRMKREFPDLTFDITTRADHVLEAKEVVAELRELGCEFLTTALEFPSQPVLDAVHKELSIEQIERAIDYCRTIGLRLNPTFIMFNPWVEFDDLARFRVWIDRVGLAKTISPLQYETRLYLYKGSPLLWHPDIQKLELIEREFDYEWKHPDSRVDQLFAEGATPCEAGVFKRCCIKC
jgi:hopanoid C-3 methylase